MAGLINLELTKNAFESQPRSVMPQNPTSSLSEKKVGKLNKKRNSNRKEYVGVLKALRY